MKWMLLLGLLAPVVGIAEDKGVAACRAEVRDGVNMVTERADWRSDFFMGAVNHSERTVLISTSVGYNKVMSLWVREKREPHPNGMFSFVDLSSGRDTTMVMYMDNAQSVHVTCRWEAR